MSINMYLINKIICPKCKSLFSVKKIQEIRQIGEIVNRNHPELDRFRWQVFYECKKCKEHWEVIEYRFSKREK